MALSCACDGKTPAGELGPIRSVAQDAKEQNARKPESHVPKDDAVKWVQSVTSRISSLLKAHAPGKWPQAELITLRGELQRAVRVCGEAMLEALRLAREQRGVVGFVAEIEHATRPWSGEADVSLFDRELTTSVATLFLEESDAHLKRLYLSLVLGHNRMIHEKPRIFLDEGITNRILAAGRGMKDEVALGYVITLSGHYCDAYAGARRFLTEVIFDQKLRVDRRMEAIRAYSFGNPISTHRLDLAKRLLETDPNRQIRRATIDLLERFSAGPLDQSLETVAFELLHKVASTDSDPDVRSRGAGELLQRGDTKSVACVAELLKVEKEPAVRASMAHDLRYASGWWGPIDNHDGVYAAQELALKLVDLDADENVRGNAINSFVGLIDKTLLKTDESGTATIDSRTIEAIQRAIEVIQKRSLPRQAKLQLKDHLENQFERKFPGLADHDAYVDLKRRLDK